MSKFDSKSFSTSRINRLLRPLRNRCISLADFATKKCRYLPATSSLQTSTNHTEDQDHPPLLLLQPPMDVGARIHFDRHDIESLEMSRKVYAVRDCFQEIVNKTVGKKDTAMTRPPRSVMSLASICSVVVGENMQFEEDVVSDDGIDPNLVNNIYEAVPLQYRRYACVLKFLFPIILTQDRFTLLSHAINLILNTTIHHPTLLNVLLNVALSHGLLYESNTVLRALLFVALSPVSCAARPPVCHPAHSEFLLELRTQWIGGGFHDQAFYSILVEVLYTVQSHEAWGSKAVDKLVKNICGTNFTSFVTLVCGCTSVALELGPSCHRKVRSTTIEKKDNSYAQMGLWMRIHRWLDIVCDHCIITEEESDSDKADVLYAFLELSLSSALFQDICTVDNVEVIYADLQGAIVCLATQWLLSPFILSSQAEWIVGRLAEITPRSSTFVTLVTKTFAKSSLGLAQNKLQSVGAILRSHDLLRLEASLWACVLHYIELPTAGYLLGSNDGTEKFKEYRHCLIDLVDDAEQRCFGVDSLSPEICHTPNGGRKEEATGSKTKWLQSEWQWEDMIGCWVRNNSYHSSSKKRKIIPEMPRRLESRASHRNTGATLQKASARIPSGFIGGPLAVNYIKKMTSYSKKEEDRESMKVPLRWSSTNFTSLLADAFSQRIVLREKKNRGAEMNTKAVCLSPCHTSEYQNFPPSDDLLDLFQM